MNRRSNIKSFTLVELLIVIAILAVLAAAVVIVLNPAELLAQARDSQRITDLKTVKDSIDLFIIDNPSASLGTLQKVYISLPDTSSTCATYTNLPALPTGWTYNCVTTTNLRNTNGTGWIPLDFGSIKGGSPMPYLPTDPQNDQATGRYYTYVMGGSYELTALMEANKENASVNDGGSLPGVYQVGTHIGLTPATRDKGLVGYWTFDEGSGATAYDSSGKGNNGALTGGVTWLTSGSCQNGGCVSLDGSTGYFNISHNSSQNVTRITIASWVRISAYATEDIIINKENAYENALSNDGKHKAAISPNWNWFFSGTDIVPLNTWVYIVTTWDGDKLRFYRDGVLVSTQDLTNGSISSQAGCLRIGARNGCGTASAFFGGYLDNVRLYGRALSDVEIKAIYESEK